MSLHVRVRPGEIFILNSPFANLLGKKLSFWLSTCSVLIVVRPPFPLVSWDGR